jgi:signal transduction histidine kinase
MLAATAGGRKVAALSSTSSKAPNRGAQGGVRRLADPSGSAAATPADSAERRLVRIALDLHDGPLQDLAALGFTLTALRHTLESLPADTAAAVGQLADVHRQLGRIEGALRAVAAQGEGPHDPVTLIELVDREVARFRARSTASVEVDIVGDVEPATASQRIAIHRVLREALENILRHSEATEVRISVVECGQQIQLRVTDNGTGFDPAVPAETDGDRPRLGLRGMRRRLELIEGALVIDSSPGGPTSVTAAVERWQPGSAEA